VAGKLFLCAGKSTPSAPRSCPRSQHIGRRRCRRGTGSPADSQPPFGYMTPSSRPTTASHTSIRTSKCTRSIPYPLDSCELPRRQTTPSSSHHQFILETQNRTMSENTEQNNKTCVPRVRKAATALTTAHITKSSTV